MLIILTTHPIQYQVPLWQALSKDGRVPFEVWYLTHHAVKASHDKEFGKAFAWDLDMLGGYPHRLLPVAPGATPTTFRQCRVTESFESLLRQAGARAVWVQGWQVAAYWQAVWAAQRAGCEVWLRCESNDLAPVAWWKRPVKRLALGQFFRRVDRFLHIGTANRRLYQQFGVPESSLHPAPYAVDNARFATQADEARKRRVEIRKQWGIAEDAFCVMFCGKLIPTKRPQDLLTAAGRLARSTPGVHLLFVGSGEMGGELRRACRVVFDAENSDSRLSTPRHGEVPSEGWSLVNSQLPLATFAGFLNQTEISRAYVAADCLVLPSSGETWGLVANEAMASGLPCVLSDHCGCAEDLSVIPPNQVFPCGDTAALAERLARLAHPAERPRVAPDALAGFSFANSVQAVCSLAARFSALR